MVPEHANILISEGNKPVMEAISRMRNTSSMPNPDTFAGTLGDMSFELEGDDPFPWEMIGLGLEEPLPSQEIIDDLYADRRNEPFTFDSDFSLGIKYTLRSFTLVRH